MMSTQKIRVGVIGVGRGQSFARGADLVGMELVALCDKWEEKLTEVGQRFGVTTYTDYDRHPCQLFYRPCALCHQGIARRQTCDERNGGQQDAG
jgi:predicted homoserine dehydrogenase-like protein